MGSQQWLGVLVCAVASAGSVWLVKGEIGVADAPAQLVPQEFRIASTETSRIVSLPIRVGQKVKAGEVLAQMDTTILEREIQVAQARLRQIAAESGASVATMESDGYAAERSFQADLNGTSSEMEAARATQAAQTAELRSLQMEITRQRGLVREGLARADRAEELEVRARSLSETIAGWPARIEALSIRKKAAEDRLVQWRTQHETSSAPASKLARLQPLRDRVSEQQEAINLLRARVSAARILSPVDGEVISVLAMHGDVTNAGSPFVIVNGSEHHMLVAYVAERAYLKPGTKAIARRRTPQREELETIVERVGEAVSQIPPRFWTIPTILQWGRQVFLKRPATARLGDAEALDVKFLAGGSQ